MHHSTLALDDTIAALASAPGPGARGIVRISGPEVRAIVECIFVADDVERWRTARMASCHRGGVKLSCSNATLPVLVYLWPNGRSYTGQSLAEIHAISSPPLLEVLLADLYAKGARPARPGEFTLRAFLAGKIDLVQAEAVLGAIDAHDHRELETALQQLAGGLSGQILDIRNDLLDLLADLEAGLDFVEEDIEFVSDSALRERLASRLQSIDALLAQADSRTVSSGRQRVALAGLPNAGKSTLFNALAGRDAAIVSPLAGTTRDYLHTSLDWSHVAVELVDTAGWETADAAQIEGAAQSLRHGQLERADLVIWCSAADVNADAAAMDRALYASQQSNSGVLLRVVTKCDLAVAEIAAGGEILVSAVTGAGLDELRTAAVSRLSSPQHGAKQLVGTTAARCHESLSAARNAVGRALEQSNIGDELVAIELRAAIDALGQILGAVYTDDLLDRIFSKFCIGK